MDTTTYLVEIRLSRTKWRINRIISEIGHRFGIGEFTEQHPHLTLYGPLVLQEGTDSRQVLDAIGTVAAQYGPVPFLIDGWEKRDGMHGSVIAFPVRPSEPLRQLTREIAGALAPITISQNAWDADPGAKWFHVTIANRLGSARASAIFDELTGGDVPAVPPASVLQKETGLLRKFFPDRIRRPSPAPESVPIPSPVLIDETGIRITVMQEMSILAEYDLVGKRWLYGDHRHSSGQWKEALVQYRQSAGLEHRDPDPPQPDDIFVIADLHLGHANIIRYCSRPFHFPDSSEMDHVLIKNWNYTVGPQTRVYCLGDLKYGAGADPAVRYRRRLRGDIVFIAGNHDDAGPQDLTRAEVGYDDMRFLLLHDPAEAPAGFDGWIIHGHHHNNDLRRYPFISFADRRINVSAEVIGYRPVSLREITRLIRERFARGDTAPVLLRPDPA